jgi:hypothetical protein
LSAARRSASSLGLCRTNVASGVVGEAGLVNAKVIEGRRRGGERSTDTETSFALASATFCAACLHREPLELHEGGLLGHLLGPRLACFLISVTNSALRAFFSATGASKPPIP